MSIIDINKLTKYYGNFKAIDNINFTINQGEIVGFVGKNGAGKSTTIRSILNILFPSDGTIKIDSLDSIVDTKAIKEQVAYVMSEPNFPKNITGFDLLKFSLKFTTTSFEKVEELARYFEIDLTKKVNELSLGNKKKLALINAFIKEAKIMILDEPTNGLDPLMQQKFFELILKQKAENNTIFLSSHNLLEIEKYCDKVIIIKDGIIVDYIDLKMQKLKHQQVVTYKTKDGESLTFDLNEDINDLLKRLSKLDLDSLEIKYKSVEDEFITYYKGDADHE